MLDWNTIQHGRREILNLTELGITGFCLPRKPGIIYAGLPRSIYECQMER
jgi:hypothetical protein